MAKKMAPILIKLHLINYRVLKIKRLHSKKMGPGM